MQVSVAIKLDTRRIRKKTDRYPVKLQIIHNRFTKRYCTVFELSEKEFASLKAPRLSSKLQKIKEDLKNIQRTAEEQIDVIGDFSFAEFERRYLINNSLFIQRKGLREEIQKQLEYQTEFDYIPYLRRFKVLGEPLADVGTIKYTFCNYIKKLIAEGRIGTAISIHDAYRSFYKFRGNVRFSEISVSWLNQFEHYCYSRELSKTTVGIHTRALRTIFNEAESEGIIRKAKLYPFGRRKYVIPKGRNIKKAYNLEQIEKIFIYQPANDYEKRSHAYWKFLYLANGMNPKDAALLKYKNIEDGFIVFERAKTIRTGRADPRIISVYITEEIKEILEYLGSDNKDPNNYIFPILNKDMNPLLQHEAIHLFIALINNWMAVIAKKLNLPRNPLTITSRHSFSTVMKNAGASTEYIQEALGHHDIRTTENYLDSFENNIKKEYAAKLTAFKKIEIADAV